VNITSLWFERNRAGLGKIYALGLLINKFLIYTLDTMKTCITCGMPLEGNHEKDFAMDTPDGPVCIHDSQDGKIKTGKEIFEGGVGFFLSSGVSGDRDLAERLTRKNMKALAYWQKHPFAELSGAEATNEEFAAAMAKF
jgi:hypothetical protein